MLGLLRASAARLRRTTALARSRAGSVNVIFGLSLIPITGLVGLGVDYGVTISNKTKLDGALDAAALAAVVTAKAYIKDNQGQANLSDNAIAAGKAQAQKTFAANAGSLPFATYSLQPPELTRTGQTLNSSMAYSASFQNAFGRIFGRSTSELTKTVAASADLASYMDFYLMVDVSGSMGLPATSDGMTRLANENRDMWDDYRQGCQFACHFPTYNGWNIATSRKIKLRSDAVNDAVCSLITRASAPTVDNQYRVGIYPFINQLATLAGQNSDMSPLNTAAQCGTSWPMAFTNLLDTGKTQLHSGSDPTTGVGSGGTHFETAFDQMNKLVPKVAGKVGDGSSTSTRKPFIFVVTDGMQNGQNYSIMSGSKRAYPGSPSTFRGYGDASWDGSKPAQIDPANCQALKDAGATISVLYIPYIKIQFTPNDGYTTWESGRVNQFSPTLATPLQQCASQGYFYTANTPEDINSSLNAMFDQALRVARLTQ